MRLRHAVAAGLLATAMPVAAAAGDTQSAARDYIQDRFVSVLSAPEVVSAVDANNRGGAAAALRTQLAEYLSVVIAKSDGAFDEIFVTDASGAPVGRNAPVSAAWPARFLAPSTVATRPERVRIVLPVSAAGRQIGEISFGVDPAALK